MGPMLFFWFSKDWVVFNLRYKEGQHNIPILWLEGVIFEEGLTALHCIAPYLHYVYFITKLKKTTKSAGNSALVTAKPMGIWTPSRELEQTWRWGCTLGTAVGHGEDVGLAVEGRDQSLPKGPAAEGNQRAWNSSWNNRERGSSITTLKIFETRFSHHLKKKWCDVRWSEPVKMGHLNRRQPSYIQPWYCLKKTLPINFPRVTLFRWKQWEVFGEYCFLGSIIIIWGELFCKW